MQQEKIIQKLDIGISNVYISITKINSTPAAINEMGAFTHPGFCSTLQNPKLKQATRVIAPLPVSIF